MHETARHRAALATRAGFAVASAVSCSSRPKAKISSRCSGSIHADTAFGNLHVADKSKFYEKPPKGFHSVYGQAGTTSGLMNDEMITYYPTGPKQQHALRYVLEIETNPKAKA